MIKNITKKYDLIFVDACSLMQPNAKMFFEKYAALFQNSKIIIPSAVCMEINRLAKLAESSQKKSDAKTAANLVEGLKTTKGFDVYTPGDNSDNTHGDNVILTRVLQKRQNNTILVLTQDKNLTADILNSNKNRSQHFHLVDTAYIGVSNDIMEYSLESLKKGSYQYGNSSSFTYYGGDAIAIDKSLINTKIPTSGQDVIIDRKIFKLIKKLNNDAQGGEGIIYTTTYSDDTVCKIFHNNKLTKSRKDKITLMTQKPIQDNGICWPLSVVYNTQGEFVGYIMRKAIGQPVNDLCAPMNVVKNKFQNLDRDSLTLIVRNILYRIKKLHEHGVLLGDINLKNFLFDSDKKVYLIDTDSYQIEKYPCEVGTDMFRAPELLNSEKLSLLTYQNEAYAISTLIYKILTLGNRQYLSGNSDSTFVEKIKQSHFLFDMDDSKNKISGPWPRMWSHFSIDLKQAFIDSFSNNGAHNNYGSRIEISQWIKIVNNYYTYLNRVKNKNPRVLELYPTDYRPDSKMYKKSINNKNFVSNYTCNSTKKVATAPLKKHVNKLTPTNSVSLNHQKLPFGLTIKTKTKRKPKKSVFKFLARLFRWC